MENTEFIYPPGPVNPNPDVIKPSPEFVKQVYRSIGAIILFIVTYVALFAASIALAAGACFLGVSILSIGSSFLLMLCGAGIIMAGIMLVFFVIKFMFKRTPVSNQGMLEISRSEQPDLFAFIDKLTEETGSPRPKKIFVSAVVNASVSYNSGFWSMFFPVGKNLNIGLGLVDAVNVSEFKAVMAHEFGHFSQRSMKFGTYVYNFNKVIYNMLYDNDGYINLLNRWARMHKIFYMFAKLNYYLIQGIQQILRGVYIIVNKTYLKLSREMEFHADAMAAFASGSNNAISSFKRISVAAVCYSNLLNYWNYKFADNKRALNFYTQHREVIKLYAKDNDLAIDAYGLPVIEGDPDSLKSSDLVIEEQWSSHPSDEDRERRLAETGLIAQVTHLPAWVLFRDKENLQRLVTDVLYENTDQPPGVQVVDLEEFVKEFTKDFADKSYNSEYRGYYNNRNITEFDLDVSVADAAESKTFAEIFSNENTSLPKTIIRLESDRIVLDNIKANKEIKTFDYRGIRQQKDEADDIQALIDKEIEQKQQQLKELDKEAFAYFYSNANGNDRAVLKNKYLLLFRYQQAAENDYKMYGEAMSAMQPVYTKMQPEQIRQTVARVNELEVPLRRRLKELVADEEMLPYITEKQAEDINKYAARPVSYYDDSYNNYAIKNFNEALSAYISAINERIYRVKKDLLNFQLQGIK